MTRRLLVLLLFCGVVLQAQTQTPLQVYTAYRTAFEQASDFQSLRPFLSASAIHQIDATPVADRPQVFALLKQTSAVKILELVSETTLSTGGHVLLVTGVTGDDRPLKGTVELIREGDWKIVRETWAH